MANIKREKCNFLTRLDNGALRSDICEIFLITNYMHGEPQCNGGFTHILNEYL